jgi:hypothetical protein
MREKPFRGPLEGKGPENRDFFGPWNDNERSECHLYTKKSRLRFFKMYMWANFYRIRLIKMARPFETGLCSSHDGAHRKRQKNCRPDSFIRIYRLIPVWFMRQFLQASVCQNSALEYTGCLVVHIWLRSIITCPHT